MSKLVFFNIPAYGHTNPTIELVHELTKRGHEVWYYSFDMFQERIEAAGAKYISCDACLPERTPDIDRKAGKDFAALIEMVADTTVSLDKKVCAEIKEFKPDCIVSDSLCFWGKLFAAKMQIPYICSTTTFAFNRYTAKLMRHGLGETVRMLAGMPRINKKIKMLQDHGYAVKNFVSIIQNDNETDTIVYTTREFQPLAETFSDKYAFVGPSVAAATVDGRDNRRTATVYISLGTVLNKQSVFYRNCIEAFRGSDMDVIISVGENTDIALLGEIPENIVVKSHVKQTEVLQKADVFITHCGMNSANESIYFGVPTVLYPQHGEQALVARRMEELGLGLMLKSSAPKAIRTSVLRVLQDGTYKRNTEELSKRFKEGGGAAGAAEAILKAIQRSPRRAAISQ
jgi:MGT family glycosyltransferase